MQNVSDLIGIGFGPSNLALAIALEERSSIDGTPCRARFIEARPHFDWFPEMLLGKATMQVSFLKDLVTLRNPRSPYSFLCYLQARERLEEFVNLREWFPSRSEFRDYLRWVASSFDSIVSYGESVTGVEIERSDLTSCFKVKSQLRSSGDVRVRRSRALSIACGGSPRYPEWCRQRSDSRRIWHSAFVRSGLERFPDRDGRYNFAVVGSGQSAAEILEYLYDTYPKASVTLFMRKFSLKAAEDTQFANEIFAKEGVALFFNSPSLLKHELLRDLSITNYSAVDADLLRTLYRTMYEDRVNGSERIRISRLTTILEAAEDNHRASLTVQERTTGCVTAEHFDGVIVATGFNIDYGKRFLEGLAEHIEFDSVGDPRIDENHRIQIPAFPDLALYLQGATERSHGLSSTLLSVLPFRSGAIASDILCGQYNQSGKGAFSDVAA